MQVDYHLTPGRKLEKRFYQTRKDPIVSIITPFWNDGSYLEEVANSVLNQTFPYFEWLIVDDGSTDKKALKILAEIEKLDERIVVYHKENGGPAKARDYGVEKSNPKSEYLVFLDSDDLMDKTFIETAYFSMKMHPDASWCYGDVINFGDQNFLWQKQFDSNRMKYENLLTIFSFIKKEDFRLVGGFQIEEKNQYEDWNLWLKLLALKKFPIHMSYFAHWYRKIDQKGELSRANRNKKQALKKIKETRKQVKEPVKAVEFPRSEFHFHSIADLPSDIVIPKYRDSKKTNLLVLVPWMTLGGADQFNLDLFRLLDSKKYTITLVSTQPTTYQWRQKFEEVCDEVFDLSSFLDQEQWVAFVDYLIQSREIDLLLNTNSTAGYMMLPYIRAKYPSLAIMDYIHMEEWYNRNGGYSRDSSGVSSVIDKTLFCNQNSEKIMHEYFGVPKEKLGTVYIGVDEKKFDPKNYDRNQLREKYDIPEDKKVISLTARIDYQKRPFLLIEIIYQFLQVNKDFVFVVAGDGQLLKPIIKKAKQYGIEQAIYFLGKTNHPDEIYAISDITLNCSIKEGLALTSYESLAMGVPVVSSDVGGQKELINDEVGMIVPCLQKEEDVYVTTYSKEEVQSYVDALQKIANQLDVYKKNCRKRILEKFTISKMGERMDLEFQQVLKNKKSDSSLSSHIDLAKELLVEYFMQTQKVYSWYCEEYRLEVYGVRGTPEIGKKQAFLRKIKWNVEQIFFKLHLLEEARVIGKILYSLLRQVKRLFIAVIKIPLLILYMFYQIIILLCSKVFRVVKRKVGN